MNIGLDLDGVIYRWHESLYRYFCEQKGYEGTIYDFWLHYVQERPSEFWDYYVSLPLLYWDTSPRPDVLEFLPKIAKLGTIYYLTHRPEEVKTVTGKFFDFYDLPFKENVIFTKDKQTYARFLGLDVFVDDLAKNIDDVSKVVKNTYLFRTVHNIPVQDSYKNVGTFKELYKILLEKSTLRELGY